MSYDSNSYDSISYDALKRFLNKNNNKNRIPNIRTIRKQVLDKFLSDKLLPDPLEGNGGFPAISFTS